MQPSWRGGVATENFVQWLSTSAPYGVRIVSYSEVTEEEFAALHDLSKEFSTQSIIDQVDGDEQEEE